MNSFSEREGFEPSVRIELVQRISNQPLSTTQPSLLFILLLFYAFALHFFLHPFAPIRVAFFFAPIRTRGADAFFFAPIRVAKERTQKKWSGRKKNGADAKKMERTHHPYESRKMKMEKLNCKCVKQLCKKITLALS